MDELLDLAQVVRFQEMRRAAPFEKLLLLSAQHVARKENDPTGKSRKAPFELGVETLAVEDGHLRVAQDQVVGAPLQHFEGHGAVRCDLDLMPVALQGFGQRGRDISLSSTTRIAL